MRVFSGRLLGPADVLAFGPGERLVAATLGAGHIDIWDAATGVRADSWEAANRRVTGAGFLADGRVVVGVRDIPLQVIEPTPDARTGDAFPDRPGDARRVAVAADAGLVVSLYSPGGRRAGRDDPRLPQISRLAAWKPAGAGFRVWHAFDVRAGGCPAVAVGADGRCAAFTRVATRTAHGDRTEVVVVALDSGQVARTIRGGDAGGRKLAFLPDGRRLAVADEVALGVWDVETGELTMEERATDPLTGLAAHPDGRRLFTADAGGAVRVWDAGTGEQLREFRWGVGKLQSVAIGWDGILAAAGDDDGRVVVWDADG